MSYEEAESKATAQFTSHLIELSQMVDSGELSASAAKEVFKELYTQHQKLLEAAERLFR